MKARLWILWATVAWAQPNPKHELQTVEKEDLFACLLRRKPYAYMFLNAYDPTAKTVTFRFPNNIGGTIKPDSLTLGLYLGGTRGALFYSRLTECVWFDYMRAHTYPEDYRFIDYRYVHYLTGIEPVYRIRPFASIRPDVIDWVEKHLLPLPDQTLFGVSFQKIYNVVFVRTARLFFESYLYLERYFDVREEEIRYIQHYLQGGEMLTYLRKRFGHHLPQYQFTIEDYAVVVSPAVAIGFWIRRGLDGSKGRIVRLLKKILLLYDPEWLAAIQERYR